MTEYPRLVVEGRANWVYTHTMGDSKRTTIGRTPRNDIELGDSLVSEKHAEIVLEKGKYFLVDLDSSNGTLLNGKRVRRKRLRNGDSILIGESGISFLWDEESDEDATLLGSDENADISREIMLGNEAALLPISKRLDGLQSALASRPAGGDAQPILTQGIDDLREELEEARQTIRRLTTVNEFILLLGSKSAKHEMLQAAVEFAAKRTNADNGFIMTIEPETNKWVVRARHGGIRDWANPTSAEAEKDAPPMSLTIVKNAITSGETVVYQSDMAGANLDRSASIVALGIGSGLCCPILYRGKPAGVLYLDIRGPVPFDKHARLLAEALAQHLNAVLYPDRRKR